MTIDKAIVKLKNEAEEYRKQEALENQCDLFWNARKCRICAEEKEQITEWLEKLKTIENIMLKYNADWYADEDNGVPDCEVLESIWNVIQDNGLDIDIEQDYRKGKTDGYNKAIDDAIDKISCGGKYNMSLVDELRKLKVGATNDD